MASIVADLVPDAKITLGTARVPHVYLVDDSRMLADIRYTLPPLRQRVLDHVNTARAEAGLDPVQDPASN